MGFVCSRSIPAVFCTNMIRPVDITIHQDWADVRKIHDIIYEKSKHRTPDVDHDTDYAKRYLFGNTTLAVDHTGIHSKNWGFLSGDLLLSKLPWAKQAIDLFADFDPIILYHKSLQNVKKHTDYKYSTEICNINFVTSCEDPNAVTTSWDNDVPYSYPSIVNTAWLIDPSLPHEIHCNGSREALQFKFHHSYKEVSAFLDQHEPIILG